MSIRLSFILLLLSSSLFCQTFSWNSIYLKTNINIRGLSVVDDSVIWISGSNGWVGRSTNGGREWQLNQVNEFEKKDFHSLYAFDAKKAIIANAGSPATVLITKDGGLTWTIVYENTDTAAFFDGIDFWNPKEGIIYGDPIRGRMLLLITRDGGQTWKKLPDSIRPILEEHEASFAASGTGIRCIEKQKIIITTGGKVSRLLISNNKGVSWDSLHTPIIQGRNTTGIFSVAYKNKNTFIIVGGDYLQDTLKTNHVFYTKDGGKHWLAPAIPTRGYRECVEYISKKIVVATGPFGSDISFDDGINWMPLSDEKSFHVIRKARKGKLIIAAGKGKISLIEIRN